MCITNKKEFIMNLIELFQKIENFGERFDEFFDDNEDELRELVKYYSTKEEKINRLLYILQDSNLSEFIEHIDKDYLDTALSYHFLDNEDELVEQLFSILIGWW